MTAAIAVYPYCVNAQPQTGFVIAIPGIMDAPSAEWLAATSAIQPTQKHFVITAKAPGEGDSTPLRNLIGPRWQGQVLERTDIIQIRDPNDQRSRTILARIARTPNATVFIDMDLGLDIRETTWAREAQWAGSIAAILGKSRAQEFPNSQVTLVGHSAGTEAERVAQRLAGARSDGRRVFNSTIAMSPRCADGFDAESTVMVVADGDFWYNCGGQIGSRTVRETMGEDEAKRLRDRGYTVFRIIEGRAGVQVPPASRLPAHSRTMDVLYPDSKIVVYPKTTEAVEVSGTSLSAALRRLRTDGMSDLVEQVKGYHADSLLVAASATAAGLVLNVLNEVAPTNGERIVTQAAERLTRAKQEAGVLYNRSREAGLQIYQRTGDGAIKVWQRSADKLQLIEKRIGQRAAAYEVPLRAAASEITRGGSVGGVRLEYGTDVLGALLERSDGGEVSLLRVEGPFRLVSLSSLLRAIRAAGGRLERMDEAARWLANITRIYGYMIEPESRDVVLIGGMSAGAPRIRADDLLTGLRAVYRDGVVPMVSLDPDPGNFAGPQKLRLIGVPDSHFARVMVEADYEMKKIIFGALPVPAGDFRSATELMLDRMKRSSDDLSGNARFWLSPVQPGPSDIQVSRSNDEALFLGRVQLLTEVMEITSAGLQGAGTVDPISEEAARLFTNNYQAIAAQRPVFRSLEGLNDVVLLATLLRRSGVKEKVLSELAGTDLRAADDPLPKSFPAVRHVQKRQEKVAGMVGGVNLRPVALKSKWARYRDRQLARLREVTKRLTVSRQLFADAGLDSLIISPPRGKRGELEVRIEHGSQKLAARQYKEAEAEFSRAIDLDGTATEAYIGRAIALAALGNSRRAFRDARKALELDPQDEDVAAMKLSIGLESGMDLSAVFDSKDIAPNVKSRAAALFLKRGLARVLTRRTQEAERDFSWAMLIDPDNAEAHMLRGAVRVELAAAGSGTKVFDDFAPQAFADLNRSIQLDPRLGSAYAERSKLKTLSYDYAGAADDASTVIRLDPKDAVGYSHRGIARAYLGKFDEALDDLAKAVNFAPNDARPYFNRGLVRVMIKDRDKAINDFASAIERDSRLLPEIQKIMEAAGMTDASRRK